MAERERGEEPRARPVHCGVVDQDVGWRGYILLQIISLEYRVYWGLLVCTVRYVLGEREGYQLPFVMYPSMFMHVQGRYHTGLPLWSLSKPDQTSTLERLNQHAPPPYSRSIAYVTRYDPGTASANRVESQSCDGGWAFFSAVVLVSGCIPNHGDVHAALLLWSIRSSTLYCLPRIVSPAHLLDCYLHLHLYFLLAHSVYPAYFSLQHDRHNPATPQWTNPSSRTCCLVTVRWTDCVALA